MAVWISEENKGIGVEMQRWEEIQPGGGGGGGLDEREEWEKCSGGGKRQDKVAW